VLTRRTATKVLPRHQNTGTFIFKIVQHKRLFSGRPAPVVKQKLAKAGALDTLQKLLGNNLVGINVVAIQWRDATFM